MQFTLLLYGVYYLKRYVMRKTFTVEFEWSGDFIDHETNILGLFQILTAGIKATRLTDRKAGGWPHHLLKQPPQSTLLSWLRLAIDNILLMFSK